MAFPVYNPQLVPILRIKFKLLVITHLTPHPLIPPAFSASSTVMCCTQTVLLPKFLPLPGPPRLLLLSLLSHFPPVSSPKLRSNCP